MSKKRKSRRFESAELERVQEVRRQNQKSMSKGLEKLSADFKSDVPERFDDNDLPDTSPWWQSIVPSFTPPMSSWSSGVIFGSGMGNITFGAIRTGVDKNKLEALKNAEPYRVTHRAPDYVEVITAWRTWKAIHTNDGWRLKALGVEHVWQPKTILEEQDAIQGQAER